MKFLFLDAFWPQNLPKFRFIRTGNISLLEGQQFEVVLKSFVKEPEMLLKELFFLKNLAFEMTRARRQFLCVANSKWLEEGGPESRELLEVFRSKGRIMSPNELLPLEKGQFQYMVRRMEENYKRKRERGWNNEWKK